MRRNVSVFIPLRLGLTALVSHWGAVVEKSTYLARLTFTLQAFLYQGALVLGSVRCRSHISQGG